METFIKKHTLKDYRRLPEGAPYQLIDGELVMSPAPKTKHQIISGRINRKLDLTAQGKGLVLYAPVDVYLDEENVYQPDILFLSNAKMSRLKEDGIYGAPNMVIEILSPSTAYYDLKTKFQVYQKAGVAEYWIVDPELQTIELFVNTGQG